MTGYTEEVLRILGENVTTGKIGRSTEAFFSGSAGRLCEGKTSI